MEDRKFVNLLDLEDKVSKTLKKDIFDFYAGGAGDEITLRLNQTAFSEVLLQPRYLRDVSNINMSTSIFGSRVSLPLLLAPVGHQHLAHSSAEVASARAALKKDIIMVASTVSSKSLEEIASSSSGHKWFQLYCYDNLKVSEWLVRRAEIAGYSAICITIDVPVLGKRYRDEFNKFKLLDLEVRNLSTAEDEKSWLLPEGLTVAEILEYQSKDFDPSLDWEIISWLKSTTKLPLIVKGIMSKEDALLAKQYGADGIVISNHGGRQLDTVPATISVLPGICAAIDNEIDVFIDGGIRRGTDILKCLALGAKAVLIGRPVIWGLAYNGEQGVIDVITCLEEQLRNAMMLTGVQDVNELDASIIFK